MMDHPDDILRVDYCPTLEDATLVLAFSGWMDGGDVSTGTARRLVELLDAKPFAEIDADPFTIYNVPGSMETTALFRPHIEIEDGLVNTIEMPVNRFYCHERANLVLFVGKEPNLQWRLFGESIFELARRTHVRRMLFIGSFGGTVPHTREPRLYVTCSTAELVREMEKYGVRRSGYAGPGSFTTYLMMRAASSGLAMTSLVAEIPAYLQGTNPMSIEAVTRRLAKILNLPLELDSLRAASTNWELQVTSTVEENDALAQQVRRLEQEYDDDLLNLAGDEEE